LCCGNLQNYVAVPYKIVLRYLTKLCCDTFKLSCGTLQNCVAVPYKIVLRCLTKLRCGNLQHCVYVLHFSTSSSLEYLWTFLRSPFYRKGAILSLSFLNQFRNSLYSTTTSCSNLPSRTWKSFSVSIHYSFLNNIYFYFC